MRLERRNDPCHISLKINQVFYLDAEAVGDAAKQFDADADMSCLDLPDVGLVASDHQHQLALGQALALPLCVYSRAKALFSVDACMRPWYVVNSLE